MRTAAVAVKAFDMVVAAGASVMGVGTGVKIMFASSVFLVPVIYMVEIVWVN
jgi:hypothetical protein